MRCWSENVSAPFEQQTLFFESEKSAGKKCGADAFHFRIDDLANFNFNRGEKIWLQVDEYDGDDDNDDDDEEEEG